MDLNEAFQEAEFLCSDAGVIFYNYTKLQNMQAKQKEKEAQKAAGDVEKAPLVQPPQNSGRQSA